MPRKIDSSLREKSPFVEKEKRKRHDRGSALADKRLKEIISYNKYNYWAGHSDHHYEFVNGVRIPSTKKSYIKYPKNSLIRVAAKKATSRAVRRSGELFKRGNYRRVLDFEWTIY